ncbi:MAG: hypothetical protein U0R50_04595 [Gaiellales bacterium]
MSRRRDTGRRAIGAAAAAAAVVACAFAASVGATDFGANDDTGKYSADGGAAFYTNMTGLGLKQTVITVRWAPTDLLAVAEQTLLDLTVPLATAAGLDVVFATYPYPPRDIEAGFASAEGFGEWLAQLARRYPQVRQFVVGNEPNQPAFFRPQFVRGKQASAALFGQFLAAGYDALKGVDPTIKVIGVGLSPRGNDRPNARSNISTSPVRFLAALGRWYRRTGRELPLMDGFSYHPYPNRATDSLMKGYQWPSAGFANLDRIKQALWDAFNGTAQPTTVEGLKLYLDEVGWQVETEGIVGYVGAENVAVTTETHQATVYRELVAQAQCDPDIAEVNIFGFYDDAQLAGFQAGLNRVDGTPRPSAQAVQEAIAAGCVTGQRTWTPARGVVGAKRPRVARTGGALRVTLAAREGALARVCVLPGMRSDASTRRALADVSAEGCTKAKVMPGTPVVINMPQATGRATVAVQLVAEANPTRRLVTSQRLP